MMLQAARPAVLLLACMCMCEGVLAAAEEGATVSRPNILIVLADDMTWHDAGCYGNDQVRTPNMDRLAEQGMRFTRAFTATAMCSPTRQQLYTGLFPVRNGAYPNHSEVKPGVKSIVHYLRPLGYRVGLAGKWHIGPPESFPFERLSGGQHLKGVREFITRDKNQPFCLIFASSSPHLPWTRGDASVFDPARLKLPPYLVDTPETRTALAAYYAEIGDLDRQLGECMKMLKKAGQADNTILIFTSEQGAQFPHCKWTCYDTGLKTAFIVRWPGKVKSGSTTDAMVQYVDVVPTLIQAAGGDVPAGLDGRSFLPILLGKGKSHRDFVYGVHTTRGIINGSSCYPIRSIRGERYKFIWNLNAENEPFRNVVMRPGRNHYWPAWQRKAKTDKHAAERVRRYRHRPVEEFYDLKEDPFELNNLAEKPELAQVKADLKRRLAAWMKSQGDRGNETELAYENRKKERKEKNEKGTRPTKKKATAPQAS